jgi:hypothetical protein
MTHPRGSNLMQPSSSLQFSPHLYGEHNQESEQNYYFDQHEPPPVPHEENMTLPDSGDNRSLT